MMEKKGIQVSDLSEVPRNREAGVSALFVCLFDLGILSSWVVEMLVKRPIK